MSSSWGAPLAWTQPAGAGSAAGGEGASEGVATEGASEGGGSGTGGLPGMCGGGGSMTTLLWMLPMVAIFYFLLIRPQQKRAKEHQSMLGAIKKGDEIITNGGLLGRVTGISDKTLTLEISEKVRVRVLKSQIAGKDISQVEKK
jgi:preprotein translocase subunit YajC